MTGNMEYMRTFVKENFPKAHFVEPEGTYLIWLDFRQTGLTVEQLDHKIIYEAGLWLDSGKIFGKTGEGFERINVACPRAVLQEALDRIRGILE